MIFVFARAATYSALFIGLLLVFLPGRILSASGIIQPPETGAWQVGGILLGALGGLASGGLLGMFVGATLLALGYQMFMWWVATNPDKAPPPAKPPVAA